MNFRLKIKKWVEVKRLFREQLLSTVPARRWGRKGETSPPPQAEKIVGEKWCYFPELYKMTKVREDEIENG